MNTTTADLARAYATLAAGDTQRLVEGAPVGSPTWASALVEGVAWQNLLERLEKRESTN